RRNRLGLSDGDVSDGGIQGLERAVDQARMQLERGSLGRVGSTQATHGLTVATPYRLQPSKARAKLYDARPGNRLVEAGSADLLATSPLEIVEIDPLGLSPAPVYSSHPSRDVSRPARTVVVAGAAEELKLADVRRCGHEHELNDSLLTALDEQ